MKKSIIYLVAVALFLGTLAGTSSTVIAADKNTNQSGKDKPVVRPLTPAEVLTRLATGAPGVLEKMGRKRVAELLKKVKIVQKAEAIPEIVGCDVQDSFGASVTTLNALSQSGDDSYWMRHNSGGAVAGRVIFVATPVVTGSPLAIVYHNYILEPPSSTSIVTPFGIPFWGGDLTSGRWAMITVNDVGGGQTCFFEVVP
jgi:hypothetical protein